MSWSSRFTEERGAPFWVATGLVLVAFVGTLDLKTGAELGFSLFYLLPVVIVTWFAGKRLGIAMSVIAAIVWYFADALAGQTYSQPVIGFWNAAIRFGFFVTVSLLLPALKELEREKEFSRNDHLTGTFNRRHFFEVAQTELVRAQQTQKPLSIVYLDVDGFKMINDQHGHAEGDKLLRALVSRVRNHLRAADVLARFGGDEFVLLLPETDDAAAKFIIEGFLSAIIDEMREHEWDATFSIGALTYQRGPATVEDLVTRADKLMYSAKKRPGSSVEYAWYSTTTAPD